MKNLRRAARVARKLLQERERRVRAEALVSWAYDSAARFPGGGPEALAAWADGCCPPCIKGHRFDTIIVDDLDGPDDKEPRP